VRAAVTVSVREGIEALFAQNLPDFGALGFRHLFDLGFLA
jgi:hypothetical protein